MKHNTVHNLSTYAIGSEPLEGLALPLEFWMFTPRSPCQDIICFLFIVP